MTQRNSRFLTRAVVLLSTVVGAGCQSPFYADRGAGIGALGGAGVGALVGNAVGNTAGGALIGAGVGALGGAAVGSAIDEVQAQNRAEIAAQLGRQVQVGAATPEEVIAMTRAGVNPALIQNYVRTSGMARPLSAQDVISLSQSGVSPDVIAVMQTPPPQVVQPAVMAPATPVIVQQPYYEPYWGPSYCRAPGVSYGVTVVR